MIEVFLGIILAFCSFVVLLSLMVLSRNSRVYHYRTGIIKGIRMLVQEKGNVDDAIKRYRSVSYDEMMRKFWIDVDEFYPNKD